MPPLTSPAKAGRRRTSRRERARRCLFVRRRLRQSAADSSGSANTGTLSGATWVAGKTGNALSFDGVNDWVTIADSASLDLTSGMTLEAWVKPQGGDWRTVALKERTDGLAYGLYSNTDTGRPSAEVKTTSSNETRGPAALATGTWSHLARPMTARRCGCT